MFYQTKKYLYAVFGTFDLNPVVHACASKKVFPFFANFAAITFLHSRPCITYKILVAGHLLSFALKSTHDCYETTLLFVRSSSESGSRNGARQCISSRTWQYFFVTYTIYTRREQRKGKVARTHKRILPERSSSHGRAGRRRTFRRLERDFEKAFRRRPSHQMPLKIIISLQLVRNRLHAQSHNGNKTIIFEVSNIS